MGIIWRSTMPMLSTLAALVIIVHSAEELDPGFRRDLRPRAVDPGTNSYEQPWKAIDAEPLAQQSTHADDWENNSPEELTARRRPVRKRRRRPQTSSETEPEDRYREGPQGPYPEADYHDSYQTTELTRRRRKRPDVRPYRWADEPAETERERPLRRRGLRRKRPTFDSNPQLSEFNWHSKDDNQEDHHNTEQTESYYAEEKARKQKNPQHSNVDYNVKIDESNEEVHNITDRPELSIINEMHIFSDSNKKYSDWGMQGASEDHAKSDEKLNVDDNEQYTTKEYAEFQYYKRPKLLSEFSMEMLNSKSLEKMNLDVNGNFGSSSKTNTAMDLTKKAKSKVLDIGIIINGRKKLRSLRIIKSLDRKDILNYALEKRLCPKKIDLFNKICDKLIDTHNRKAYHSKCLDKIRRRWYASLRYEENRQHDEESQEYDPIDPFTLKQILKKSNGTSLSEILQRHNLSLSDLLRGRGEAILALNKDASREQQFEDTHHLQKAESQYTQRKQTTKDINTTPMTFNADEIDATQAPGSPDNQIMEIETNKNHTETERLDSSVTKQRHIVDQPHMVSKHRFPTSIRRKLRMRPMINSTLKAQLGRDLIALSARKYSHNNKTLSKSKEWKDVIPMMINKRKPNDDTSGDDITEPAQTTTDTSIDTTVSHLEILNSSVPLTIAESSSVIDNEVDGTRPLTTEPTTTIIIEVSPSEIKDETEKPNIIPIVRPVANNSGLRRQAFNSRLKRKRLKQKSSTTESPNDDLTKKLFGMGNLVSASQFIERTQKPHTTITQENTEYVTELEDFMTTQVPTTAENKVKSTRITASRYTTTSINKSALSSTTTSTTEQSAKFEIEEILNDTMTSERLERILRERNMTLNELVKHRERGSSHVHLADIFHNASKEPNPPEPFLTKSSIEPISKETYPLRAILEANIHDTTARSPTIDTAQGNDLNIPVVMDFGNNVNENGENMGIISLFNKLTQNDENRDSIEKTELRQDSNGTPYLSSVLSVNATNTNDTKGRERRVLGDDEDMDGWDALLSLINNPNLNDTKEDFPLLPKGTLSIDKSKISLEDDVDGDGLIILEDLQHLKDFDSNIASASDEKLEIHMFERNEKNTEKQGILNKLPNTTRSVAIATASILGLATILFLLIYIALKYKQHRSPLRKKDSFCNDRIPSPVFEHRKGHKNHCSSRSISPMISNSNIYTMSTIDSHNGKESPDYMWNSLRKPFQ